MPPLCRLLEVDEYCHEGLFQTLPHNIARLRRNSGIWPICLHEVKRELALGQSTNEDAMDNVFGPGFGQPCTTKLLIGLFCSHRPTSSSSWRVETPATPPLRVLCRPTALPGGVALERRTVAHHVRAERSLNSATVNLPDNIVLSADQFYGSAASSAWAADISQPIFHGPKSTSFYFTGDFFSHGYFSGTTWSPHVQQSQRSCFGTGRVGLGLMVFGGMTTDNFQLPQPAAHALLENIISFTAFTTLH